jgi:hypothetical protein
MRVLTSWTIIVPVLAWLLFAGTLLGLSGPFLILAALHEGRKNFQEHCQVIVTT